MAQAQARPVLIAEASDPITLTKLLRHGGRPHMGCRFRMLSQGRRERDYFLTTSASTIEAVVPAKACESRDL
jgi:hypothetical protein